MSMLNVVMSYLPYSVITIFTPGPNNLMSLYAVSSSGWRNGLRLIAGITAGFVVLASLSALFCHQLARIIPEAVKWLKYFGAVYILWLAWRISTSRPKETQSRPVSFNYGFFLAVSNVKSLLFMITIFTAYVIPAGAGLGDMFAHCGVILVLSLASWFLWGAVGGAMRRFIAEYYRPFNIVMGLALVWCAIRVAL